MQSSIQGPLLRSGQNSVFKALGETGYPVFRMAFQLREAIHRFDSGRDLARHLAIPHNNETGDQVDWYSSFPGDVIPWANATEVERASACQQFEVLQKAIYSLSEQFIVAGDRNSGGDRRAFAQLLKLVVNFPDQDFIYLVNGVLVITFWGFIHKEGELRDPMHWLRPPAAVSQESTQDQTVGWVSTKGTSSLQASSSRQTFEAFYAFKNQERWWRSWRRLLWALLLLLGFLLALFTLRSCAPSISLPGLPNSSISTIGNHPIIENTLPDLHEQDIKPILDKMGHSVSASDNIGGSSQMQVTQSINSKMEEKNLDSRSSVDSSLKSQQESENIAGVDSNLKESTSLKHAETTDKRVSSLNTTDEASPLQQPSNQSTQSEQNKPLLIPPATFDGPAKFLNGKWKVNGGIQDKQTGKPLQLEYTFKSGVGSVSLRQSNGVLCNGTANGHVDKGILNISNDGRANCSDGSSYMIPDIECRPLSTGSANCTGQNEGERQFPIRMLQYNS